MASKPLVKLYERINSKDKPVEVIAVLNYYIKVIK